MALNTPFQKRSDFERYNYCDVVSATQDLGPVFNAPAVVANSAIADGSFTVWDLFGTFVPVADANDAISNFLIDNGAGKCGKTGSMATQVTGLTYQTLALGDNAADTTTVNGVIVVTTERGARLCFGYRVNFVADGAGNQTVEAVGVTASTWTYDVSVAGFEIPFVNATAQAPVVPGTTTAYTIVGTQTLADKVPALPSHDYEKSSLPVSISSSDQVKAHSECLYHTDTTTGCVTAVVKSWCLDMSGVLVAGSTRWHNLNDLTTYTPDGTETKAPCRVQLTGGAATAPVSGTGPQTLVDLGLTIPSCAYGAEIHVWGGEGVSWTSSGTAPNQTNTGQRSFDCNSFELESLDEINKFQVITLDDASVSGIYVEFYNSTTNKLPTP